MKYDFACEECGRVEELRMKPDEFSAKKEEGVECECGEGKMNHVFNPGDLSVCFKGDGWMDKIHKENEYREKRAEKMSERQSKHHKVPELVPNYEGQETESWREAKSLADKDDRFTETYDSKIDDND